MIALLRGEVVVRRGDAVVISCGGVGYKLAVSTQTLAAVPPVGSEATLHTHLVVRDDALALYGFASEEERDLFLLLLGVQSIGPKVAIAVLGGGSATELYAAIAGGDVARFQAVPGIGKRTAERIIVELREKVGESVGEAIVAWRGAGTSPRALAREALVELGFAPPEVDSLLTESEGESAEEIVAAALRATHQGVGS